MLTPTPIDSSSATISWATRVRHILGLDRAIAFTVLARGWSGLAGLVTVILIARFLSPSEQGFYFTFGSLVAMQLVFELGFSVVILQLATHECAHLTLSSDGSVTGSAVAHCRLASVLQKSVRWYTIAAILMVGFLIPAGIHFFSVHQTGAQHVAWLVPWSVLVVAAGFTFQIDPVFSFLEGCGYVSNVAHTRLWQAVCGSVLAWAALVTHHGLFAPAMLICGQVIAGLVFLVSRRRLLLSLLRWDAGPDRINWGQEVWPFQWRIAVSYSCGFFIFQLFNPVLFVFWGPVVAGQMGMSLSMGNMLASVAIAWVNTKAAPFGALIARREYGKLDSMFAAAVTQATVLCLSGAAVLWGTCVYFKRARVCVRASYAGSAALWTAFACGGLQSGCIGGGGLSTGAQAREVPGELTRSSCLHGPFHIFLWAQLCGPRGNERLSCSGCDHWAGDGNVDFFEISEAVAWCVNSLC